jgi:hypothetical protein
MGGFVWGVYMDDYCDCLCHMFKGAKCDPPCCKNAGVVADCCKSEAQKTEESRGDQNTSHKVPSLYKIGQECLYKGVDRCRIEKVNERDSWQQADEPEYVVLSLKTGEDGYAKPYGEPFIVIQSDLTFCLPLTPPGRYKTQAECEYEEQRRWELENLRYPFG